MKIIPGVLIYLTAVFAALPVTYAQQSEFDAANELLNENRYADALVLYKEIENDEHESGALWLNMGISYSQLDSLGMSKYYLLRALEFPETAERAELALQYVNSQFAYQSAVLPQLPWIRFMDALGKSPGITNLAFISFFFLYAGTVILIFSWFRKKSAKALRYGYLSAFALSFLIISLTAIIQYQESRYGTGIVVARQGQVYQYPDESSAVVNSAHEGYLLRVDYKESGEHESWYSIRLENGMYGWIRDQYVKVF